MLPEVQAPVGSGSKIAGMKFLRWLVQWEDPGMPTGVTTASSATDLLVLFVDAQRMACDRFRCRITVEITTRDGLVAATHGDTTRLLQIDGATGRDVRLQGERFSRGIHNSPATARQIFRDAVCGPSEGVA